LFQFIQIQVDEIVKLVKEFKGIIIPSHVNRKSNGIISVLGFIPKDLDFKFIEISNKVDTEVLKNLKEKYKIIKNSDAHRLVNISERINYLELKGVEELFY